MMLNENIPVLCETEATYNINAKVGESIDATQKMGDYRIDLMRIIKEVFSNAVLFWIILSLLASFSSHVVRSWRWRDLLKPLGFHPSFHNTFFAVIIMYLANMAFPRLGEVMRCGILARYEKIPIEKSLGTMITERLIDMLLLLICGLLMIVIDGKRIYEYLKASFSGGGSSSSGIKYLIIIAVLAGIIALYFFLRKSQHPLALKFRKLLEGLWEGIKSIRKLENPLLFVFQSVLIWVLYLLTIYFAFMAVPEIGNLGFGAALSVLFFGSLAIVAVQGGLGLYPIVSSQILLLYGINQSIGYAFGWLTWTAQSGVILIAGLISLILLSVLNRKKNVA